MSWRAIRRCVSIWEKLTPASRRRLVGTPFAANQSELQLLSEQSHARQEQILGLVLAGETSIDSVRSALEHLDGHDAEDAGERRFRLYCEGFTKLSDRQVDTLIEGNRDLVLASLRRQGVIR